MKAFYIIHISVILETIFAIFIALKLNECIAKTRQLGTKIEEKAEIKLLKIKDYRERLEIFNKKCEEKFSYNFDFLKKLAADLLLQSLLSKYLPKTKFLSKIKGYKTTIICFLVTFFFFRKKNA